MRKRGFLFVFLFVLCLAVVYSNQNYYQEANADLNLAGGKGFIGYSTNDANVFTSINYTKCSIGGSLYTPIATDINNDSQPDIINPETQAIRIYDSDCGLITEKLLPSEHEAMPVLLNWDGDDKQNIMIMLSGVLNSYEYQHENDTWSIEKSIDYTGLTASIPYFTCFRGNDLCYGFKLNDVYVFDISAGTVSEISNELGSNSVFDLGSIRSGVAVTRISGNVEPRILVCISNAGTSNKIGCEIINETGEVVDNYDLVTTATNPSSITYSASFIGKMGSIVRAFNSVHFVKSGLPMSYSSVTDLTGSEKLATKISINHEFNRTSNFVLGDYDHDGINDVCYLQNISNTIYFKCWDNTFLAPTYDIDVSAVMNWTTNIVMADFCSSSFSGIGTVEGIFCSDGTTFNKTTDSYIKSARARNGQPMIIASPTSGSPIMVYTDISIGWILRNSAVVDSCGNSICDVYENEFSCPVDCALDAGEQCITNDDCPASYPWCLFNMCIQTTNVSLTCTFNTDCPYDAPFCYNNICVSGISGGFNISQPTGRDDAIENSLNVLFGANAKLKFIAALVMIIAVVVMLAMNTKSDIVTLIGGILMTIFCTVFGLLPVYVLILIIIAFIGIGMLKVTVFGGGSG